MKKFYIVFFSVLLSILIISSTGFSQTISGTIYNNTGISAKLRIKVSTTQSYETGLTGEAVYEIWIDNPSFPYNYTLEDASFVDGVTYYIVCTLDVTGDGTVTWLADMFSHSEGFTLSGGIAENINLTFPEPARGTASVSGTITYNGSVGYSEMYVCLFRSLDATVASHNAVLALPGSYTISGVEAGDYYVKALIDTDYDQNLEDSGYYTDSSGNPVLIHINDGERVPNIDITFGSQTATGGIIKGTITNNTSKTGTLIIWVFDIDVASGEQGEYKYIIRDENPSFPYSYEFSELGLEDRKEYWVAALLDMDGDNQPDQGELLELYPTSVILSGGLAENINLTLEDEFTEGGSSVFGTVNYSGQHTGQEIIVALFSVSNMSEPAYYVTLQSAGSFEIPSVSQGTYYIGAFIDINGDHVNDAMGSYLGSRGTPEMLNIGENDQVTGINITVKDINFYISGTLSYSGAYTGYPIFVTALDIEGNYVSSAFLTGSGDFEIPIFKFGAYIVVASIDANGDRNPEAFAMYTADGTNPQQVVIFSASVSGININLKDTAGPIGPAYPYISGTVSYSGSGSYSFTNIVIAAFPINEPRKPRHGTALQAPGNYRIKDVRDGKYKIRALY
ncbi:hypothetical protein ACFL4T_11080, partial [candidate division KSB1 bacterium]